MIGKVAVIGSCNIDITGKCKEPFKLKESNIGSVTLSLGGVGKNIVENLSLLGLTPKFITILGNDDYAKIAIDRFKELKLDLNYVKRSKKYPTGTYLNILDNNGDMVSAINHMDVIKELNEEFIFSLNIDCDILCLDTNFSKEALEKVVMRYKENTFLMLECVSATKAKKAKDIIGCFDVIKANVYEAGALTEVSGTENKDVEKMGEILISKGVKEAYISMDTRGVYGFNNKEKVYLPSFAKNIGSATGAGDAMMAGIVYAKANGFSLKEACYFSSACAAICLESYDTVNQEITYSKVMNLLKERKDAGVF